MDEALLAAEFAPEVCYLNTASHGLLPARTVAAVTQAATQMATGHIDQPAYYAEADAARAAFARLVGTAPDRVAAGSAVSTHVGLIAASLPPGARVLAPENEFSSVVNPFTVREDVHLRTVPLEALADAVDDTTTLVALSAVQSVDGRIADLPAVREAARAAGARVMLDVTQAAGWLPLSADDYDYVVCGAYKWLLCPRGTSFLVVSRQAQEAGALRPLHAGWVAGASPWDDCYGPIARLAPHARAYEQPVPFLSYVGAARSLALIEELGGPEAIGAHDRALAARFRAEVAELDGGYAPVPGDSAVVAVPGLGHAAERLAAEGVSLSVREGNLRAGFHLYNTEEDVDRLLRLLRLLKG
ncbi:aminotransferase class V-fold PLP-dependent enzyme [Streptomyces tubbatahanensis]|uniref:Aminotransferase class V-fold PLP-dependent enzyme n=1 Tax=Streptomyces tubbatahanensis TaxID=2923272 RepID=A0ABY3XPK2_9ACTN|nr:aminotransferase class V-fold PLP-dependent enzyme [Streptomyces tubbatahanensis]UNS96334.1 aminotransferase class V-fold PLP-dependent enzyme [Streptomyces tubbatahanensis]